MTMFERLESPNASELPARAQDNLINFLGALALRGSGFSLQALADAEASFA